MHIQKTEASALNRLMPLFDEARGTIAALGIDQWQDGYPSYDVIADDITKGHSFIVERGGAVVGTFALIDDGEPTYDVIENGEWLSGNDNRRYLAIHRVAVAVAARGSGVSGAILDYAAKTAVGYGFSSLRIDTHEGNVVMRRMLEKHGFVHCGTIYLQSGAKRVAYEKQL